MIEQKEAKYKKNKREINTQNPKDNTKFYALIVHQMIILQGLYFIHRKKFN